jgi:hypothetical protein
MLTVCGDRDHVCSRVDDKLAATVDGERYHIEWFLWVIFFRRSLLSIFGMVDVEC